MKLLVLTNNPARPSYRQRVEIYLAKLAERGVFAEVVKLPKSEIGRLKLFKKSSQFDGVLLQKKCLNFLDTFLLRRYAKKIIYDFDDAIMYSPHQPDCDNTSHFRLFRRTARMADMIIAGNSYLAEHAKRFNDNVHILPTGLDTKEYNLENKTLDDGKIRLVWIGSKSTLKYLKQISSALEEIGSRFDNVVLRIICDEFFDLQNMEVEKFRWSLGSQCLDLTSSDIGLAPLSANRFTGGKCGFKVLQYSAAGLPAVTSPVGVNCEYVIDGVTGYHASEITQWVEKVSNLILDAKLREQMADAARKQVQKFDSDIIGRKLCKLITNFVEGCVKEDTGAGDFRSFAAHRQGEPKVSVCIPTYNRKDYLRKTLESIFAQTYKDYQIVIVDDGSTDGTEDMIKQLDFPVTYYKQENQGDAAARNKLIELAEGKYISFIDSDDLLMPDAIERMVKAIEPEDEDVIVYGSYHRIDQAGNVYGKCKRELHSGYIARYLFETILVHSCGSMFPKSILKEPEVFDTSLKICSDYDLWLRLSLKYRFVALPEPTFKRRRHSTNLSDSSLENCLTEFQVLKRFYYEKGGKEVIPEKTAIKVFSKEGRRAGRCAIKEGLYDQACQLLRQSFRQHPNLKSLISWIRAIIAKKMAS